MKKKASILLFLLILICFSSSIVIGDDYVIAPAIPDKYLKSDGSITTWSGTVISGADANRAAVYTRSPYQIAKWLLPDGSIASALPFSGGGGVETDTNCDQSQYYTIGKLCQDTDNAKLYKGTGTAIEEIASGTGDISQSGSPANHYWAYFTADKTITGVAITASKPVCSDANGNPAVCAGTEGVWQVAGSYLTSANIAATITNGDTTHAPDGNSVYDALALKQDYSAVLAALAGIAITVDGNNVTFPGGVITTAANGSRIVGTLDNTTTLTFLTAGTYGWYFDNGVPYFNINGTGNKSMYEGGSFGGLIFGDSSPDAAGEIGYDGDLKWYDTALRVAVAVDKTQTLTNKTFDANGTGNVLKGYSYIQIPGSAYKLYGSSVTAPSTTATAWLYNLPKFSNSADKANNYVDFMFAVPPDIDTAVDLTATLSIQLGGADTGDHAYILSMCNPAASAAAACTPGTPISLSYSADDTGADGDIEYTAETTLTDWKSNVTAGRMIRVRIERDGDDGTNDASTVDSYPLMLSIKYGYTN